jgi:hypothetical protein
MTDLTAKLTAQLQAYRADRERILGDGSLSQSGKLAKVEALKSQSLATMTATANALWFELESAYNAASAAIRTAASNAAAGWDYQRLAWASSTIPSLLVGVNHTKDAATLYAKLSGQGDVYIARAAAETLPALLVNLPVPEDERAQLSTLITQIKADAVKLLTTPATRAADAQAGAVVNQILAAKKATEAVLAEFGLGAGGLLAATGPGAHPLVQVLQRVVVETTYDSASRTELTSVEFMPQAAPQDFFGKPASRGAKSLA